MRQVVDGNGNITLAQSYTPFGDVMESTGSGESAFGYTGEQLDATGLLFLRARYYQPGVGRFMSRDPFRGWQGTPYSLHPYQYGYSNPLLYTDPSGRCMPEDTNNGEECFNLREQLVHDTLDRIAELTATTIFAPESTEEVDQWLNRYTLADHFGGGRWGFDGYVFGRVAEFTISVGGSPFGGAWEQQCDLYNTIQGGVEVVFDFHHQQVGVFSFHATGNVFGLAGVSIGGYRGITHGFDNVESVANYAGYAAVLGGSFGWELPFGASIDGGVAVPFNPEFS